jgi:hypothetical protein
MTQIFPASIFARTNGRVLSIRDLPRHRDLSIPDRPMRIRSLN